MYTRVGTGTAQYRARVECTVQNHHFIFYSFEGLDR